MDSEQTAVQDQTDFDSLVEQMVAGNSDAFRRIVEAYHSTLVVALCRGCGGDISRAEDAAQQTWLLALTKLSRYEIRFGKPWVSFRSWLMRLANNALIDAVRKGSRSTSMGDDCDPAFESLPIEERHEQTEEWATLEECLRKLSARQQEVFLMSTQNESYREIAKKLGINLNIVGQDLTRARDKLKTCVSSRFEGEVPS